MLLSGRGEGGDSKLRPESEDDAASWLWGPGFHSLWEEQQGAGPEGKDSAWSQGGTETSTAGVGDPTGLLGLASTPGASGGNSGKN